MASRRHIVPSYDFLFRTESFQTTASRSHVVAVESKIVDTTSNSQEQSGSNHRHKKLGDPSVVKLACASVFPGVLINENANRTEACPTVEECPRIGWLPIRP
ncbi:hypothetical protein M378DRAFT_953919 [Amanita muscaria Koide BX008]|uniref:Uncharacterized protein n=1 Tax=Amanita muscaria (strain Koide BX008) TaxID=946122 RepID=A0A0C2WTU5_AMAMK|nr:hypothetical protein M378DRAFT_953919 [Amanita muscaria Koide BX008]